MITAMESEMTSGAHVMKTLAIAALLTLSGCTSAVVGAECRYGLSACAGECVDLSRDPESCGACGVACGLGEMCVDGTCAGGFDDAGARTGWIGADAGTPPPVIEPERPRPIGPPNLPSQCELGTLACGGACVRADRDRSNCGACGVSCASGELCVEGACAAACEAPAQQCGDVCVDTSRDPDHCGACGVRCDAGVCVEGACESPRAGHLVVIGHDYTARRPGMSHLIGNAALLPSARVVRVLSFEGASTAASRQGARGAIGATARERGRDATDEAVTADRLSYRLAYADVLLVHAQSGLATDDAARLGHEWEVAIGTFLERGGTVVALVSAAEGDGTLALLASAALVAPEDGGAVDITGAVVTVVRSADAIAIDVPLAYQGERSTVRLPLDMESAVVTDGVGPVVVHRAITPLLE